jgi:plastocyanin
MTSRVDRSMRSRAVTSLVTLLVLWAMGCDSPEQTVDIVAEEFRFTPSEVRVAAEHPIRLRIVNAGREPHEFKSVLLARQTGVTGMPPSSLPVLPNHKAETVVRTIPGVYLFSCAMRGHAGMSGTIIVE